MTRGKFLLKKIVIQLFGKTMSHLEIEYNTNGYTVKNINVFVNPESVSYALLITLLAFKVKHNTWPIYTIKLI